MTAYQADRLVDKIMQLEEQRRKQSQKHESLQEENNQKTARMQEMDQQISRMEAFEQRMDEMEAIGHQLRKRVARKSNSQVAPRDALTFDTTKLTTRMFNLEKMFKKAFEMHFDLNNSHATLSTAHNALLTAHNGLVDEHSRMTRSLDTAADDLVAIYAANLGISIDAALNDLRSTGRFDTFENMVTGAMRAVLAFIGQQTQSGYED